MTHPIERASVEQADEKRRAALIERLGTIADLACSKPLECELGDIAYDLLREAAAQIASDRLHLANRVQQARDAGFAEGRDSMRQDILNVEMSPTTPSASDFDHGWDAAVKAYRKQMSALSAEANEGRCDG